MVDLMAISLVLYWQIFLFVDFDFQSFQLDETRLIAGMSKETDDDLMKKYKADLDKITKFLIRQTTTEHIHDESETFQKLKKLNFWEFLFEVGMFASDMKLEQCTDLDKQNAKIRYMNAISAGIQGSAAVILKRDVKDIFVNGFNRQIMKLHQANHDLQI